MRKLALILALTGTQAAATGLEIDVAGQASGTVTIDLFEETAPAHADRITTLATQGAYNGVVFHRVIDGFMAQTGDVQYGDRAAEDFDMRRAGTGGSDMGNLDAEFSDEMSFARGTVGMARAADPDSANSQFFIMFAPAPHLDGQYTVVGEVTAGMDVVDAIKRGEGRNGAVIGEPDWMEQVRVTE
jgi:peptidylprolyl isomerase